MVLCEKCKKRTINNDTNIVTCSAGNEIQTVVHTCTEFAGSMVDMVVVLRKEVQGGAIVAFFPELVSTPAGDILCYAHVGQHSHAALEYMYENTQPVELFTNRETSDLLEEIRGIYSDSNFKKILSHFSEEQYKEWVEMRNKEMEEYKEWKKKRVKDDDAWLDDPENVYYIYFCGKDQSAKETIYKTCRKEAAESLFRCMSSARIKPAYMAIGITNPKTGKAKDLKIIKKEN